MAFWHLSHPCLIVLTVTAATAAAQATTGAIHGTIRDNLNAVVPRVTVTARHVETNGVRRVVSDVEGNYRFLNLPVGDYELTTELAGFAKFVRSGITISLNQN